ncbi:MAG: hypothetical protein ABR512_04395 [Desulfopila sp.]
MDNIDKHLSVEVKQDIAKRFFGFRRTIEKDTGTYLQNIERAAIELEQSVGHDLVRIYHLLKEHDLISRFRQLTELAEGFFFDAFINTEPRKQAIINNQKKRGFTRKGCLHNLFFDAYEQLYNDILNYQKTYNSLEEDHATLCEQINIFYRKNDIETIFQFLRGLDNGSMGETGFAQNRIAGKKLDAKLRLTPPAPVSELLPSIAPIPKAREIRKKLRELITSASRRQP